MTASSKGIWLNIYLDIIEREKGKDAIKPIEGKYGTTKFSGFKNYPAEVVSDMTKITCEILFGEENEETLYELGKLSFLDFAETQIGKITLRLYGDNTLSLLKNIVPLVKSVTDLDVIPEEMNEEKLILNFKDSTYSAEFYHGMVTAAAEKLNVPIKNIKIEKKDPHNYSFIIYWKEGTIKT